MGAKQGQSWYLDFTFGIIVFSIMMVMFFTIVPNTQKQDVGMIEETYYDGKTFSQYLMSEGYPTDWNQSNVRRIGLLDDNRSIDPDKVKLFWNMSEEDYPATKTLLAIRSDYAVFFTDMNDEPVNISNISYIGHSAIELGDGLSGQTDHLVKFIRIISYDQRPHKMEVYVWR